VELNMTDCIENEPQGAAAAAPKPDLPITLVARLRSLDWWKLGWDLLKAIIVALLVAPLKGG
jgi:hypothetical protein